MYEKHRIAMENFLCNVYVLGNPLEEVDALPIKLLPRLREAFPLFHFSEIDPTENFPEEKNLIIIDTIINTRNVCVWTDVEKIKSSPSYSLHDFDLGMTLKIMQKMGKLKKITIFGVPPAQSVEDEEKIFSELVETMSNSLLKNEWHN
jgi:Ni,Fe-hydrogenase maturation factor